RGHSRPGPRMRETNELSIAGAETQSSGECRWFQDRAPATERELLRELPRTGNAPNLLRQFFSRENAAFQRISHCHAQPLELLKRHAEVLLPRLGTQVARAR